MTPSLEGLPTKAKEVPSPHEVRLALLDTNSVFQSLGGVTTMFIYKQNLILLFFLEMLHIQESCNMIGQDYFGS